MIAGNSGGFHVVEKTAELQVGVVIRKQPGVTRWAKWVWRAVGVLPGAGPADLLAADPMPVLFWASIMCGQNLL